MKRSFSRHLFTGTVLLLTAIFISSFNLGYSNPSKYENKIVTKVDFVAIEKRADGTIKSYSDLKNISQDELYEVCVVEEGSKLKSQEVREGIKAVFKEGKFADVRVEIKEYKQGVWVRFYCEERPLISNIEYRGIEELQESELAVVVAVKRGDVLRLDKIEQSIAKIKQKYVDQGLYNAVVQYKVQEDKNEEGSVEIIFIIDEGEDVKVERISILGAKKIPDHTLLSLLKTKGRSFVENGEFKRSDLDADKGMLIAYYKKHGYLDAEIIDEKVEYQWVDPDKKEARGIYITLRVKEGDIYYFDGYTLEGNKVFKTSELEQNFLLNKDPMTFTEKMSDLFSISDDQDKIFDEEFFHRDRQMISFKYANLGYINARVYPVRKVTVRKKEIDGELTERKYVHFKLNVIEGKKAYIENIIIKGNKKTLEKVIRRELVVKEGELFSSYKVQLSREKIFGLGFFKEVNLDIRPGSQDDKTNLIVDVEEQPTGTLSLGGGYGTGTGFTIFSDVGQKNLFGTGRSVNLRLQYGPTQRQISLNFIEPWLLDYPVQFNASVFYTVTTLDDSSSIFSDTDEEAEYQKQSIGYSLGLTRRFWIFYGAGVNWSHSFKSVLNPTGNASDEILIDEEFGIQQKRKLRFHVYRNSKDNSLNPTRGWEISMGMAFVGGYLLRGHDHYLEYTPKFAFYYSPFHLPYLKSHPTVIELRASATLIKPPFNRGKVEDIQSRTENAWLDVDDRQYIGGTDSVRGWARNSNDAPKSWELGMYHKALYGAEYRVPIHPQYVWVAAFFDAGSLWGDPFWEKTVSDSDREIIEKDRAENKLRNISYLGRAGMKYWLYSYGFGVKVQIPMMPLRFWWGKKMLWVGEDEGYFKRISGYNFQFAIGDMRF